MIIRKTGIDNAHAISDDDKPAHLGVLNAFFRALGWNVQVSRHDECDGGQLYFHDNDDLIDEVERSGINVAFAVDASTFYMQTVDMIHRADDMTFGQWVSEATERHDTGYR